MTQGLVEIVQIEPTEDAAALALYEKGVGFQEWAEGFAITSDAGVKTAADNLSVIKGVGKAVEVRRVELVGPLNKRVNAINAAFKTFGAPLVAAEQEVQGQVRKFRAKQQRDREEQEEINRLRELAAQKDMALNEEISEPVNQVEVQAPAPTTYRTTATTMSIPKVWKYEVMDFAKLPDEYKVVNDVYLRRVVIAKKGEGDPIPGVRIYQEESLSVRPKMEAVAPPTALQGALPQEASRETVPAEDLPF